MFGLCNYQLLLIWEVLNNKTCFKKGGRKERRKTAILIIFKCNIFLISLKTNLSITLTELLAYMPVIC